MAPAEDRPALDGVLVVDKPSGPTSHDVVAEIRRHLRIRRVGHTGTLDPLATGVLPLVLGRATRLARFLAGDRKTYDAVIRFGWATTTYDALGEAVGTRQEARGLESVHEALAAFLGTHLQHPPAFSAKKLGGVPAYERARREQPVDIPPVEVTLFSVGDVEIEGDLVRLRLECSAGYYVRSLAHDLGEALGCGAHLAALRRTRSGDFTLDQSVTLEDVLRPNDDCAPGAGERPPPGARCRQALVPLSSLLPWAPRVTLTEEGEMRVSHGRSIEEHHTTGWQLANALPPDNYRVPGSVVRVFSPDGTLVALATPAPGGPWPLHPGPVL